MKDFKKFNLDTIGVTKRKEYSVVKTKEGDIKDNVMLLQRAMYLWMSFQDFRDRAMRNYLYYRGDQWHEMMTHPDTDKRVKEEDYIRSTGRIPLKQNIIRIILRNILGQFRLNKTKTIVVSRKREGATESEMLTNSINAVHDINHMDEIDARELEQFLLSGAAGFKVRYQHFKNRNTEDVKIMPVNMYHFFCNTDVGDIRLDGIRIIGQFYDESISSVIAAFADTPDKADKIKEYYKHATDQNTISTLYGLDENRVKHVSFLFPQELDKCRVYEIWEIKAEWRLYVHDYLDGSYKIVTDRSKSELQKENEERIEMAQQAGIAADKVPLMDIKHKYDQYWYGKFLTPTGEVLWEGETVYNHGEHPFVLLLYPLVNGGVWGFTEDFIDQQRYINRLIQQIDFMIGNSAKGVLLVPEGSVPDDEDPDQWASKWTKFNGVMYYTPKPGVPPPQQVVSNSVLTGVNELLSLQFMLVNKITGVHGAIQGQAPKSGTPASLYAQEAENASINLRDMVDVFNWFRKMRDIKALKVLIQYYKKRHIFISGQNYAESVYEFDPEKVKNMEWELVLTKSMDSPTYRHMNDTLLYELLTSNAIDIEMFLESSSAPFADKMLAKIRAKREEMQQNQTLPDMGQLQEMMPAAEAEARQKADPAAMRLIDQALMEN